MMNEAPTNRDIADFFRVALSYERVEQLHVPLPAMISWADSVIEKSSIAEEWMIDLSMVKTRDAACDILSRIPPPATEHLGASILVAYIGQQWRAGVISRESACFLLFHVHYVLTEEHDIAAVVPSAILDDEMGCLSQGIPVQFQRVDQALSEFFTSYRKFEHLIPGTL